MKNLINNFFSLFGYRFKKITSDYFLNPHNFSFSLDIFLRKYKINLVLVIGAHDGKFYRSLVKSNYKGKTISFEPSFSNFKKLKNMNKENNHHKIINIGFGEKNSKQLLTVTRPEGDTNTLSDITTFMRKLNKKKLNKKFELVNIKNPLDYFSKNIGFNKKVLLKIDASGYDFIILKCLKNKIQNFDGVIVDACIDEKDKLYKIDTTINEFIPFMNKNKFKLYHINTEKIDTETGRLVRTELFFVRNNLIKF